MLTSAWKLPATAADSYHARCALTLYNGSLVTVPAEDLMDEGANQLNKPIRVRPRLQPPRLSWALDVHLHGDRAMKTRLHRHEMLAATAACGLLAQARGEEKESIALFNGRDLEDLRTAVLADAAVKPADVWSVVDRRSCARAGQPGYFGREREDFS